MFTTERELMTWAVDFDFHGAEMPWKYLVHYITTRGQYLPTNTSSMCLFFVSCTKVLV